MSNFAAYEDSSGTVFTGHFEYEGSVGPAGYTPERGVDYWTPDDVAAMEAEVQEAVNTEHAADFTKLDGIEAGAEVNIIEDIKVNGVSQTVTDKSVDISVPTNTNQLTNGAGFIKATTKDLVYYTKTTDSGRKIVVSINPSTYVMTVSLRTTSNTEISSSSIDLPLESMVVSGTYDEETKKVILTLQSGSTVEFSIADLISGLVPDSRTIAGVDLADDITKNELLVALNIEDGSQANVLEGVQVDGTDLAITNKKVNITGLATEEEYNQLLDQIPTGTITTTSGIASVNDSSNLPLKDVQILGNATQADTPTPTTPQAIHVVTGDVQVNITGKNLFDITAFENSLVAGKILNDNGVEVSDAGSTYSTYKIPVQANVTYHIKGAFQRQYIYNASGEFVERTASVGNMDRNYTPIENGFIGFQISNSYWASNKGNEQIEIGSTATTFVKYQGTQTVTLPLGDIELAKIGTYQDYIYKDNGKWYLYKTTDIKTLDGSNDESYQVETIGDYTRATYTLFSNTDNIKLQSPYMSTKLKYLGQNPTASEEGIANTNITTVNRCFIFILSSRISTNMKDWLASNNLDVWYVLPTPTTTEITDTALITALEQVLAMTTYKNTTNFSITPSETNATGDLTITYRQDISSVLSTIATLEARVELLEQ